jgi:hypothetical protein
MPDINTPALNADGMLKDATEIEWLNSLSDESHCIALDTRKHKRSNSSAQQTLDSEDNPFPGLKNKAPAKIISSKQVPKLSDRAGAGAAFQSPKSCKFFQSKFMHAFTTSISPIHNNSSIHYDTHTIGNPSHISCL